MHETIKIVGFNQVTIYSLRHFCMAVALVTAT
jgi:hypothetical protein